MLVFKVQPCENFLLPPPPNFFTTTNPKPHLLHHHHHHHHHHVKLLHFSLLKARFKSTLSSSSSPLSAAAAAEKDSSSSSLTTTTVDFLMESGGLSYEQAIQVIRQVPTLLNNGGMKPRSVIAYFESIGFSKTHISKITSKKPEVLVSDVEKTLKPKIQLFLDFGFSKSDIAELMTSKPTLLHTGVETHLKPALDLIKSFVKTDDDEDLLIKTVKRNNRLLLGTSHFRNFIEPNIHVLRQHGVPDSEIVYLIFSRLSALMSTPEKFKSIVKRIMSLGFKPETKKFSTAVAVMSTMKKPTWDSKIDLLKGLGWSEVHILDAFIKNPGLFMLSGEKMKEGIEFFKEESLNWDASVLSRHPALLNYSLKRRVIPRYAVLKCLMSKEIIKQDTQFISMLKLTEKQFLSKYVFKYQEQLPFLYEVYEEKEWMLGCEEKDNGDINMTV